MGRPTDIVVSEQGREWVVRCLLCDDWVQAEPSERSAYIRGLIHSCDEPDGPQAPSSFAAAWGEAARVYEAEFEGGGAVGAAQLDALGRLLGCEREGRSDVEFRAVLRGRLDAGPRGSVGESVRSTAAERAAVGRDKCFEEKRCHPCGLCGRRRSPQWKMIAEKLLCDACGAVLDCACIRREAEETLRMDANQRQLVVVERRARSLTVGEQLLYSGELVTVVFCGRRDLPKQNLGNVQYVVLRDERGRDRLVTLEKNPTCWVVAS